MDVAKLAQAMEWVIPADSSPGAGSAACVAHFLEMIRSQPIDLQNLYLTHFPALTESDLADPGNGFAQTFIDQVRDVYYSYPDTGSWDDIGFRVTDP